MCVCGGGGGPIYEGHDPLFIMVISLQQVYVACHQQMSVQFSSVQDGTYALGKAHNYALHPISERFPQRCLWYDSNVRQTDDGPLSSFQGRSSSASFFHASL